MISPIHDTTPPANLAEHREKAVRRLRAGGPPPATPCVPLFRDGATADDIARTTEQQDEARAIEFRWAPVLFYLGLVAATGAYALYRAFNA